MASFGLITLFSASVSWSFALGPACILLTVYVSFLENNLEEGKVILAHGFGGLVHG